MRSIDGEMAIWDFVLRSAQVLCIDGKNEEQNGSKLQFLLINKDPLFFCLLSQALQFFLFVQLLLWLFMSIGLGYHLLEFE